jgi:hypothetical protein
MKQKVSGFQRIITAYESWLFICHPCDSVRVNMRDEIPKKRWKLVIVLGVAAVRASSGRDPNRLCDYETWSIELTGIAGGRI